MDKSPSPWTLSVTLLSFALSVSCVCCSYQLIEWRTYDAHVRVYGSSCCVELLWLLLVYVCGIFLLLGFVLRSHAVNAKLVPLFQAFKYFIPNNTKIRLISGMWYFVLWLVPISFSKQNKNNSHTFFFFKKENITDVAFNGSSWFHSDQRWLTFDFLFISNHIFGRGKKTLIFPPFNSPYPIHYFII